MSDELQERATDGATTLRRLLQLIDAGEIAATPARTWYLRGAAGALDALLTDRPLLDGAPDG